MLLNASMNSSKKLSVIIVSYNEQEYLGHAIESCLQQKFAYPYEIIIGDDGSNDGSIDLIREYAEKYPNIIKYYVMDRTEVKDVIPSIRVSNVLKRGFEIASGEYLTVLSGDDFWCDNMKWHRQVFFLDNNQKHASCYTDFKYFWSDDREELRYTYDHLARAELWSGYYYVHISCFVFRRDVLLHVLDRFCDDTGLIFSIFKAGKTKHIKGVSFAYRQRDGSIMHEAKRLELNVLEVALFQDIRNSGGYIASSYAKYALSLLYVYRHRAELERKLFNKYFCFCEDYPNNFLKEIGVSSNPIKPVSIVGTGLVCLGFFALANRIRKIMHLFSK